MRVLCRLWRIGRLEVFCANLFFGSFRCSELGLLDVSITRVLEIAETESRRNKQLIRKAVQEGGGPCLRSRPDFLKNEGRTGYT